MSRTYSHRMHGLLRRIGALGVALVVVLTIGACTTVSEPATAPPEPEIAHLTPTPTPTPTLAPTPTPAPAPAMAPVPPVDRSPTVRVRSPLDSATIKGKVLIEVEASDDQGIKDVSYSIATNAGASTDRLELDPVSRTYKGAWDTGVMLDGSYRMDIRASDTAGQTATASVTVRVDNPPAAPGNLTLAELVVSTKGGSAELSWTPNRESDLAGYNIYRSTSSTMSDRAKVGNASNSRYRGDNLSNGVTYYYAVTAVDKGGNESALSDALAVEPRDTRPPTISNLTVAKLGPRSADILWSTDKPAVSRVLYGVNGSLDSATENSPAMSTNQALTLKELQPGTTYSYRIRSVDAAGNEQVSEVFTLKTPADNPPSVAITSPSNSAFVKGAINVRANARDDWKLEAVEYSIDDGDFKPIVSGGGAGSYEVSLDTKALDDGLHTLSVRARDDRGQVALSQIKVQVENKGPSVSNVRVQTDLLRRAIITWSTSKSATSFVVYGITDQLGLRADSGESQAAVTHRVALEDLQPGTKYFYRVHSVDARGNETASDVRNFTTQAANPPTVTIGSPASGIVLRGTLDLQARATSDLGVPSVQYAIDSQPFQSMSRSVSPDSFSATISPIGLSDGSHTIKVRAVDSAGQSAEAVLALVIDNQPPIISAASASNVGRFEASIQWTTNELSTSRVEYGPTSAMGLISDNATLVSSHFATLVSLRPGNTYFYRVISRDVAGNEASSSVLTIQTPGDIQPTVAISAPADGARATGSIALKAHATDDWRIVAVEYVLEDGTVSTMTPSGTVGDYEAIVSTTAIGAGARRVTVRARDDNGAVAQAQITVVSDPPPSIAIVSPAAGTVVSGVVTLRARVSDNGAVSSVKFASDAITFANMTLNSATGLYEAQVDTTLLSGGNRTLTVRATDDVQQTADVVVAITVDNPPKVSVVSPSNGGSVGPTFSLQVNASDDINLQSVTAFIDGGAAKALTFNAATGRYVVDIDAKTLVQGPHTVLVRATDTGGHTAEAQLSVTYDNQPPAVTGVQSVIVTPQTVNILWTTNEPATSLVDYGPTDVLGLNVKDSALVTSHKVTLPNLKANSKFFFKACSADAAGNPATCNTLSFTTPVDNPPTVTISAPVSGAFLGTVTTLQAKAQDDFGFTSVTYAVDGGAPNSMTLNSATGLYEAAVNVAALAGASHTITVVATDTGSQAAQAQITVQADAVAPAVALVSPAPSGTTVTSGSITTVQVNASDAGSGLASVRWQRTFAPGGVSAFTGLEIFAQAPLNVPTPIHPSPKADTTPVPLGLPNGTIALFVVIGTITSMNAVTGEFQIGSPPVFVYRSAGTVAKDPLQVGDRVKIVANRTLSPGPIVAEVIRRLAVGPQPAGAPTVDTAFLFNGTADSANGHIWKIGGIDFIVDDPAFPAAIDAGLAKGSLVTVEFTVPAASVPPNPNPTAWQPLTLNTATSLWEVSWPVPKVVLDSQGWLYIQATDKAGNVTQSIVGAAIVANGRTFSFTGTNGAVVSGKVSIEPVGVTKPNRIGITYSGLSLAPSNLYTLKVANDAGANIVVNFTSSSTGTGSVVFEADTDLANATALTLTVTGPGF